MKINSSRKLLLFTIFLIFFLDMGGLGIVFVTFPPLIVSSKSQFVSPETSESTRNLILGFLYAAYPITQFFGATLLGGLSDRIGRKKILLFTTFFTAVTFGLSAVAISMNSLGLLFISRLLGGFAAGNGTVAQASVADFIEESKRPRWMAAFSMIGGLSWIVCPSVGSILVNKNIVSWFSYEVPFIGMAIGFFFAFFCLFSWKENVILQKSKIKILSIMTNFKKIFEFTSILPPLFLSLITIFAWLLYQTFMAPYMMEKFKETELEVGFLFAYFSTWWFLGGLVATQWLKKHSSEKSNLLPLFAVGFSILAIVFVLHTGGVWFTTAIANFFEAISVACFFGIFSSNVPSSEQGKIFGFWNSGFALSNAIAPALSGWLSGFYLSAPFILAAVIIIICAFYYLKWYSTINKKIL